MVTRISKIIVASVLLVGFSVQAHQSAWARLSGLATRFVQSGFRVKVWRQPDQKPNRLLVKQCISKKPKKNRVKELLNGGRHLNFLYDGKTPLLRAVEHGNSEVVSLLLEGKWFEKGIDTEARLHPLDPTPLRVAVECGDVNITQQLLEAGANVNANSGVLRNTPLHKAASGSCMERKDNDKIMAQLILHGADLHAEDADGCTPIVRAMECGQFENVLLLHKAGASVSKPILTNNSFFRTVKETPLHVAARAGKNEKTGIVTYLLSQKDVDPNARDKWGRIPLEVATDSEVRKVLLRRSESKKYAAIEGHLEDKNDPEGLS